MADLTPEAFFAQLEELSDAEKLQRAALAIKQEPPTAQEYTQLSNGTKTLSALINE